MNMMESLPIRLRANSEGSGWSLKGSQFSNRPLPFDSAEESVTLTQKLRSELVTGEALNGDVRRARIAQPTMKGKIHSRCGVRHVATA